MISRFFILFFVLFNIAIADIDIISPLPKEILADFCKHWLMDYVPHEDECVCGDGEDYTIFDRQYILWDFNLDRIVNFKDYAILCHLNHETVMKKYREKFEGCSCGKTIEHLVYGPSSRDIEDFRFLNYMIEYFEGPGSFESCRSKSILNSKILWINQYLVEWGKEEIVYESAY
ncbi:MAG: hypothetical protein J7L15_06590 [Clostridiales bacterium]|nr:hypothetical protein [Clostridiales bacterium]